MRRFPRASLGSLSLHYLLALELGYRDPGKRSRRQVSWRALDLRFFFSLIAHVLCVVPRFHCGWCGCKVHAHFAHTHEGLTVTTPGLLFQDFSGTYISRSLFSSRPPEDTCPPAAARLYDMCHLGSTHVHDIRCFPLAATTSMVYLGGTAEDAPRPAHQCDACGKTDFKGRKVRSWRCGAWRRHLIAVDS